MREGRATVADPGVGSTHCYAAYTCVHGSYPPLSSRIDPGEQPSEEEESVAGLMQRVEVAGHKDRPAFAPRITVRMRDGTRYENEFNGDKLKWDLATETRRISALFADLPFPKDQLDSVVQVVAGLEGESGVNRLIQLCIRPVLTPG